MNDYTLITGASSGIGYEFAKIMAKNNHNLILVARREKELLNIKDELLNLYNIKIEVIPSDITNDTDLENLKRIILDKSIFVNILINNAGFGDDYPFLDANINKLNQMVDLNISALMNLTYYFGNLMKNAKTGKILNVASVAGLIPGPYMACYYATKAFVLSFSEALAVELKNDGISVTCLLPGPTNTGFSKAANIKSAKAFKKTSSAYSVAKVGYNALMKGRVLAFHGVLTKFTNFGIRLVPRSLIRLISKHMNYQKHE